ncbi:MAG: hypothetical protein AAGA03_04040 [Planctomycetota bacterium]
MGKWTAIRFGGLPTVTADTEDEPFALSTLDSEGGQVDYRQAKGWSISDFGYVVPGREAAPLQLRRGDSIHFDTRFPEAGSPTAGPSMVPLGMPWLVVIGDPMGVESIGANELLDRDARIAVSMPTDAAGFPDRALGYEGVNGIVINASGIELLSQLSQAQTTAIGNHIRRGGRLFLTLGDSARRLLQAAPWLNELTPFDAPETDVIGLDGSGFETYATSQTRLKPFGGVRLPRDQGTVLIMGRTARRVSTPLAASYGVGLGRVTIVAADLDAAPFDTWPDRTPLLQGLNESWWAFVAEPESRIGRTTGFDDLAGQVRATLDQFPLKRTVPFSLISLVLIAFLISIGPLDYWLVNRLWGRPLLGWLTFPLVSLGLSGILTWQAMPRKTPQGPPMQVAGTPSNDLQATTAASPDRLQGNQLEVVDIDPVAGVGRGFVWSHLYSHPARQTSFRLVSSQPLQAMTASRSQWLTAPFGYPGTAFGGIEIAGQDQRMPTYGIQLIQDRSSSQPSNLDSELFGLPFAPRSSRSLATQFVFEPKLDTLPEITRRAGSDLLGGDLVNPLPVDLLDGLLIYRNWVYLLPTRVPAYSIVPPLDSLRQKNFRWQLARQKALESASESEDWDGSQFSDLPRVAEIMMFHQAVGGSRYTGMNDYPLSDLDLSELLDDDRCMLVGRLSSPLTQIESQMGDKTHEGESRSGDAKDQRLSIDLMSSKQSVSLIRVLLPVKTVRR